jgi:hypothetical protein
VSSDLLFSTPSVSILEEIEQWHGLCAVSVQGQKNIAMRLLNSNFPLPTDLEEVLPPAATIQEIDEHFNLTLAELKVSAILNLIASFEAKLRIDAKARATSTATDPLALKMRYLFRRYTPSNEYRIRLFDDIVEQWGNYAVSLPALDPTVLANFQHRRGVCKQNQKIRNWIAHGRSNRFVGRDLTLVDLRDIKDEAANLYKSLVLISQAGSVAIF